MAALDHHRLQQRLNNNTNDLELPFEVHTNNWQQLRLMHTVVIVANRYFKLSG